MTKYIATIILLFFVAGLQAQDTVIYRTILIGDAGEINKEQEAVIAAAASHVIGSRTTVLYLGDNIYPKGIGAPGTDAGEHGKAILNAQFRPLRAKGAAVYFVPGNHDWDRMGPEGLTKIKRQWAYLEQQQDSLLKLLPPDGCPDPVAINVSDSLTIIVYDSEWWLFPYQKREPGSDCNCSSTEEVTASLQELLYQNRYKVVLLASHHPFRSYGHHGGYFSWKDHIFPFTAINKALYIPLPVAGSLYPVLRKIIVSPEDRGHPLYKTMIREISRVTEGYPNLLYVAGHDHGLQFIKDKHIQVVSGGGAKEAFVKKGKNGRFAIDKTGFVIADLLPGNRLRLVYYAQTGNAVDSVFAYTQPYTDVQEQEEETITAIAGDSISVRPYPAYDSVGKLHRFLFGENYRKEYAAPTTVPVIRISEFKGGLRPVKLGGGHQTHSLRLEDKEGNEWALRSIEKYPEVLLPEEMRETFAKDLLKDNMSSQHPFSALIVPVLAKAARVPHATPIIGWVAPDRQLGIYGKMFANTLCLLEEREPAGNSDNTVKMYNKLDEDNDNSFDSTVFFRARLLDILIGDWDRHEDQWRWVDEKEGSGKRYIAVPRDRDQVFYINDGLVPWIASRKWLLTFLQGINNDLGNIEGNFWESRNLNGRFLTQFSLDDWKAITSEFVAAMTDSVLETSLRRLPASSYNLRARWFLQRLKARRDELPKAMERYYYFINKIVDIKVSDKHEWVQVTDAPGNGLLVEIYKLSKKGKIEQLLYKKIFTPDVTKEIRLYLSDGDDSVKLLHHNNAIKLRIVGGDGDKVYLAIAGKGRVRVYDKKNDQTVFMDTSGRLKKHLSNDSLNTVWEPVYLYNVTMPLVSAGFNADDGFLLGLGFRHTQQEGFRKKPYASLQQLLVAHSFSTNAYNIRYRGEWIQVLAKADIVLEAIAKAPNNTVNFFGRGNETDFVKAGDYKTFYRTRFNTYQFTPSLRWRSGISLGPTVQYYSFDTDDNAGRFINNTSLIGSYDSATIDKDKAHAGVIFEYTLDKRRNPVMPVWGAYVNFKTQAYKGLNSFSESFAQVTTELAFYKSLNRRSSIVLANRTGGGISVGKTAFYQSLFIGGHENLLGYRQYRFAGKHSLYNNLELRIKLTDISSYVLPGQFGLIGFYDIGRVWEQNDHSDQWHSGAGGGIYFSPILRTVIKFVMGNSKEGWYPYVTMGMRF